MIVDSEEGIAVVDADVVTVCVSNAVPDDVGKAVPLVVAVDEDVEVAVCVCTELNVAVFDAVKVSKDVGVDVGSEEDVAEYIEDVV